MPKPAQDHATFEELDAQLAELADRSAEAREKIIETAAVQQEAAFKELAAALNLDFEARAQEIAAAHLAGREAAAEAAAKIRDETRSLVRRQAAAFEDQMRALRKSGFAAAIEKACHNPRLLMKLCFDWHGAGSPPPGMTGVSNTVDWDFESIDDPMFGAFLDRMHAHAGADAGDRHYEYARGDVDLTLRYRHAPLAEQTVAEQVSVDLSAFGFIESGPSTDAFGSQTRAMSAGGSASLSAAVTLAQDYTWPSGLRGTNRLELESVGLARCNSLGAVWVLFFIPIHLGGAPCWEPISLRRRLSFPAVFPIYGRSNPREPYGDELRVEVRLRLRTSARGEGSDASIDFRRSEGYSMRVHDVIVHTAD